MNNNKRIMLYEEIIKFRDTWMGLAIVWIVFFHSGLKIPVVQFVKASGYGGVDIFIFASGIGCFCSLSNNSNCLDFMIRRAKKLLPTYYVFMLFWIIYKRISIGITFQRILANVFCDGWFLQLGHQFNWYIDGIWLLYFLAPYLFLIVKNDNSIKKHIIIGGILMLFSVTFWKTHLLMLISRIPLFYLGMHFANTALKNEAIEKKDKNLMITAMITGMIGLLISFLFFEEYLDSYGLLWYPFILIVPGLCFIISFILSEILTRWPKSKLIAILRLMGKYTFEVYLVHILLFDIFKKLIETERIRENNAIWFVVIIMIIPTTILLVFVTGMVRKKIMLLKEIMTKGEKGEKQSD